MTKTTIAALAALLLAGCGGGGSSSPIAALSAPTSSPSNAPTSTPTNTPTSAPTQVPLSQRVIGGAPISATASQLARVRTQAKTTAQGVTNGLPILVESSGMVAQWAGDIVAWATNLATSQDIPETAGTITPSGNLSINNPGFSPLSCLGQTSAICIVHPTGWTFGTTSANGKPVGKQTLTIAFGDGTSGTTADYVYDGWSLACNTGWAYVSGVPVVQATRATSDVYADCVNGNLVFPKGGMLFLNPSQDQYGRTETIMPTVLAAINFSVFTTNIPMVSTTGGQVYGIATQDGGFAKVWLTLGSSATPNPFAAVGMSLHSNPDGTYSF